MTGFGRGSADGDVGRVTVEIRSHNHRFLDVSVRMPGEICALEDRIRKALQGRFSRGRLDTYVGLEESSPRDRTVEIDRRLAKHCHDALTGLAEELRVPCLDLLPLVAGLPGVVKVRESPLDLEAVWAVLGVALDQAASELGAMRKTEGDALRRDLIHRIARVAHLTDEISRDAPMLTEDYRQRLTRRVAELVAETVVPEDRLTTEIVLYAERSNIAEELVRLESHISQFRELAESEEAVGRKAEFILQEMVRETNTIGSKTQDPGIGRRVVEMKGELEKLREQVQNIE